MNERSSTIMQGRETDSLLPNRTRSHRSHRSHRMGPKASILLTFFTVSVLTLMFLRQRRASTPDYIDHDFGVAFDLTIPYGTAAISFRNGTVVNVAKITGSVSYQAMMARLSLTSSEHLHPPYNEFEDFFRDQPRQAARLARKEAGLPASSDVGLLAQMISELRSETEWHLGRKISGGVATIPHLPALYAEDLEDAFEYLGLIYLAHYPYWRGGYYPESSAVYVAHGFGICSNYTDVDACDYEKHHPPHQPHFERILTVSLTRSLLVSAWSTEAMWFSQPGSDNYKSVRTDLGLANKNDNSDESYYWEEVRRAILRPAMQADRFHWKTDKVIIHGEGSTDRKFQKLLSEWVNDAFENKPEIFHEEPVFAGARGAAEMAKRVWYRYNQTGRME